MKTAKQLLCLGGVFVAVAVMVPASASAAPAVPFKCDVKGQILPSTSIVTRGTISYACSSTYLGTSTATCPGTITGTTTQGTCTIGMLTVIRCQFKGTYLPSRLVWKGALKVACGLPGTPPPRVDCAGEGGGSVSTTGAIKGTISGYCQLPGLE